MQTSISDINANLCVTLTFSHLDKIAISIHVWSKSTLCCLDGHVSEVCCTLTVRAAIRVFFTSHGISIDVNKMWSFNPVAFMLFVVELYHILGHAAILFRVRLLPRKDLVRIRYYFLFDAASVFITCFLYTGRLKWLASLQILQHLYYFVTWNKSALANKIMDWSSLDYFKSHKKDRLELDSILGTAFDISVHVLNVYMLMSYLTTVGILLGLAVAHGSAYFILYNPRLAWSSPYKMPAWIERRIRPLQP